MRPTVRAPHRRRSLPFGSAQLRLLRLEDRTVPTSFNWIGAATSGDQTAWTNALNWFNRATGTINAGVPGAGDTAFFSSSYPSPSPSPSNKSPVYNVTGGGLVGALNFEPTWGGTLTLNQALSVSGASEWDSGTIETGGGVIATTLFNQSSGTLTIGGAARLFGGGTLSNNGTIVAVAGSTLSIDTANPLFGTTTLANQPAAVLELQADAQIYNTGPNRGAFKSLGTLRRSTGGAAISGIRTGIDFTVSGLIDVQQGTIRIGASSVTATGTTRFTLASGALVEMATGGTVAYQGTFIGSGLGQIRIGSDTLQLAANTTFDFPPAMLHWPAGTIGFNPSFSALTIPASGAMTIDGTAHLADGGTLSNSGKILLTPGGSLNMDSPYGILQPTKLINRSGGICDFQADVSIYTNSSGGAFNNDLGGILLKSGGNGTASINLGSSGLSNTGTVLVQSGTFALLGVSQVSGTALTAGTWNVSNNTTLTLNSGAAISSLGGSVTLDGPLSRFPNLDSLMSTTGSGSFAIQNGRNFTAPAFSNAGVLFVGAGSTFTTAGNFAQPSTGGLTIGLNGTQYGQVRVNGSASLAGTLNLSVGTVPPVGAQLTILSNGGSSSVTGNFAGLPEGASITVGGTTCQITYRGGANGRDVVLTVTAAAQPVVASIVVNSGQTNLIQRSMVTNVTVTFDRLVTFMGGIASAFQLSRTGPGTPIGNTTLAVDLSGSTATQTVARLTFSGSLTEGSATTPSLIDGNYQLTVFGNQIQGGLPGGDYVTALHRLFGDVNGDKTVNLSDLTALRNAFGSVSTDANYVPFLDFSADGAINLTDLTQFRNRFGVILP